MADSNRPTSGHFDTTPDAAQKTSFKSLSWLDGLPHDFDGWGPKTSDAEATHEVTHTHSELTWAGEPDERHHVWTFQRSRRRHH